MVREAGDRREGEPGEKERLVENDAEDRERLRGEAPPRDVHAEGPAEEGRVHVADEHERERPSPRGAEREAGGADGEPAAEEDPGVAAGGPAA